MAVLLKQAETQEDIATVAALAKEIWHRHYDSLIGVDQVNYMVSKFQSQEAISEQINQGTVYKIALWDEKPVGYYAVKKEPEKSKIFLSKVYIDKEHRGKGIATVMLRDILDIAEDAGLKSIYLTVNKNNKNSIAVYEKMGFRKVDEVKADIGDGFFMDDYIMEQDI